jgi:UDP-N-acetylmuramyl pentapeptide phosphotransferase/UDP-N-acetylglucosamine-1-phosphate transferase
MLTIPILNAVAAFMVAAIITWVAIPKIVKVSRIRNLTDQPGHRKIHKGSVPTLGGIGIFSGLFISIMLFVNGNIEKITIIAAATIIIFLVGVKDDLINMNPRKKLVAEGIAALLITILADIRITNLHGFLGIELLPMWLSIIITVILIIFVINAFNLLDGIDGLAASFGIMVTVIFAVWFWIAGDIGYSIMAASVAGALSAFLPYNVSHGRFKIFMGDTGSLTIGLLLAILTIRFNELNLVVAPSVGFFSAPSISLAILMLPLFDTVRVTIIRLYKGRNPFTGDNNHIHHRMLRLGLSHTKSTLVLVTANMVIILLAFLLDKFGATALFLSVIAIALAFSWYSMKLEKKLAMQQEIEENFKNVIRFFPEERAASKKNLHYEENFHEKYESVV